MLELEQAALGGGEFLIGQLTRRVQFAELLEPRGDLGRRLRILRIGRLAGTPGGEPKPTDPRRPEEAPPTQKGPSDKTESTSEHTGLLVEHSPTALG